jgi:NAD(P)-dependent dehydrogenase (short-subunit alcohol dehydrogenase family)
MAETRRIALVTGGNKGIGLETCRQLGMNGLRVFLGARHPELGRAAAQKLASAGYDVTFVEIDLARPETIQAAANLFQKEFGRLDILVNNAGITDPSDGPPGRTSIEAVHRVFETNFFGALAVTQAMLGLIRSSRAGVIVNVSSGLGSLVLNSDRDSPYADIKLLGYGASKAALNMLTVQLAYELRDTAIKVNASDPGYTATDLNGHRGHQTVEEGAAATVRLALLLPDGSSGGFFSSAGPNPW